MRVQVDLGSLKERQEAAVASLREQQPAEMKSILDAAAEQERGAHEYENRTGAAEASTEAGELTQAGDLVSCELGMGVDYAIFLDKKGLTGIVAVSEDAADELQAYFNAERDRIAGI